MANLITHSLTYSKQSVLEYVIKPLFIQNDIRDIVTIRTDIKNSEKLDFVDKLSKITKAYAQGTSFVASTGITITQKTLEVEDMKAEVRQNGKAFLNQVKEAALKKGVNENDISGTLFEEIVMSIFFDALAADLQRQLFFGNTKKTTYTSDLPSATADANYNVYNGFWTRIMNDFADATIAATQKVNLNVVTTYQTVAAVAGVWTTTLTGTSGTGNITVDGTAYLVTFDTDLTETAEDFKDSHAATILARGDKTIGQLVVTSSGADVIFTEQVPGAKHTISNNINATGNLAGNTVITTAVVQNTTLVANGAQAAFKAMYEAMPPVLRKNKSVCRYIVTASFGDNYRTTLESSTAGSEAAYWALVNGQKVLAYRGIPIIEREEWDVHIDEDFGSVRPHRAMLVIPQNLVVGTDGQSDDVLVELYYDKNTQENVFRVEYKAGTQYVHPDYVVAAF